MSGQVTLAGKGLVVGYGGAPVLLKPWPGYCALAAAR